METFNVYFTLFTILTVCHGTEVRQHKVDKNTDRITCSPFSKRHIDSHFATLFSDEDHFMSTELPPFLVARPPDSSGSSQVRKHIKSTLKALNWTVERDISNQLTVLGFKRFVNVIATHDFAAKTRIVLACHYDSKLFPRGFIGAMDSAVPCAILIHFAKTFHSILDQMRSNTTIQLLFLDGEEALLMWSPIDSLYGSRNLAKVWANSLDRHDPKKNNLENIDAFILLDLIGHKDTQIQRFYKETDDLYTQLIEFETCLREMGIMKRPNSLPPIFRDYHRLMSVDDDQNPFRKKGVKKIMHLITTPFPSTWHSKRDDVDSIDSDVIHDFNKIFGLFITHMLLNAN